MQKKALKQTIEDFGNALEQGACVVYRRNFESPSYEYMGGYIEKITGYPVDEVTPQLWDSLIIATEHRGELSGHSLEKANELVRSGQVERWQADVNLRTRSGEIRWVTDMSTILRDDAGRCTGCLGVLMDITDRKEAERKLADLTERLRLRNEEMDAELALAREVQQALVIDFPGCFPFSAGEDRNRVEFHHRYIPAEMLAGDSFDVLPISENEVGVFICDVVGHGVRAALLTTFLRGLIEELIPYAGDPGCFLTKINNGLRSVFGRGDNLLFASAFYLVINVNKPEVRYASAGHPSPLCLKPKSGSVVPLMADHDEGRGPALGIVGLFEYLTLNYVLEEEESILMYTDGVFEACKGNDAMFGEERVVESLRKNLHGTADAYINGLIQDIHDFTGSELFEDDACLLAVVPRSGKA